MVLRTTLRTVLRRVWRTILRNIFEERSSEIFEERTSERGRATTHLDDLVLETASDSLDPSGFLPLILHRGYVSLVLLGEQGDRVE